MTKTRLILRLVILVIIVALLLWRQFGPHGDPAGGAGTAHPAALAAALSAAPDAGKPAPPRHWQLGRLDLTSCELPHPNSGETTAAWCKEFDVAENPGQSAGRHITLHLAVIRSQAGRPEPDIVVMLAGGPGEAATEGFANTAAYSGLLRHHHVLLLDQRGTGASNPLTCTKTAKALQAQGDRAPAAETLRTFTAACLAEVQDKADPRYYTTTIATGDLEQVRQALGAPPFDLIGVSYGTRMAQQYLMRHPEGVRSVVLDSPVPNALILGEDFAANLDAALKLDFADCEAAPACKQAYGDPMSSLYKLRDELQAHPRDVTFRDPRTFEPVSQKLNAGTLAVVARLFAYSPESAALLPLSIDAAAKGNVAPLLGQERLLESDLAGDMDGGMAMSVICSEDADLLQERPEDAGTILGNLLIDSMKAECAAWPHGTRPADFHAPLHSGRPVLILSGDRDPVTPPRYGAEIIKDLANARQLVLKGQAHGEFARGCTPKLIEDFINDPRPGKLDASCLDRLGPTPAYIGFNGAAP